MVFTDKKILKELNVLKIKMVYLKDKMLSKIRITKG